MIKWFYSIEHRFICKFFLRFFFESRDAFSCYFGITFTVSKFGLACTFFLIGLVFDLLSWLDFSRQNSKFAVSTTDISAFHLWQHNALLCMWQWLFSYFRVLFLRKIGHRTIWATAKLFIRIQLDKFTTETTKILYFDAGKCTATTLLWRMGSSDFEFVSIHQCKWVTGVFA